MTGRQAQRIMLGCTGFILCIHIRTWLWMSLWWPPKLKLGQVIHQKQTKKKKGYERFCFSELKWLHSGLQHICIKGIERGLSFDAVLSLVRIQYLGSSNQVERLIQNLGHCITSSLFKRHVMLSHFRVLRGTMTFSTTERAAYD